MIQRIQSVYLLIAFLLILPMAIFPMAEIVSLGSAYEFTALGLKNVANGEIIYSGLPILILIILSMVISLVTIFGYKKRMLQIRLTVFNTLIMLGLVAALFVFVHMSAKRLDEAVTAYKIIIVFPFVAAVFNYLAIRAIGRDEALIRSIDRIR